MCIALVDISWKKWSQPTFSPMATGRFLNRELRYQEGATSKCSARQNWGTERAFCGPQCAEEMSQKEIWRNSRSLPRRLNISWFAARNWLDWRNVHCDGQLSTGRPLLLSIAWRVRQVSEEFVYNTTHQEEMHQWNSNQTSEKHLQICTVSTVNLEKSDPEPIPFCQYQRWHPSSSSSSTWWCQWNEHWWIS